MSRKNKGGRHTSNRDYAVGYGRPPVSSRFKPGQSGNPKGRPVRLPTALETLEKIAREKVEIEGGLRISRQELLLRSMMNRGTKGEGAAIRAIVPLLSSRTSLQSQEASSDLTQDDAALLEDFLRRHGVDLRKEPQAPGKIEKGGPSDDPPKEAKP